MAIYLRNPLGFMYGILCGKFFGGRVWQLPNGAPNKMYVIPEQVDDGGGGAGGPKILAHGGYAGDRRHDGQDGKPGVDAAISNGPTEMCSLGATKQEPSRGLYDGMFGMCKTLLDTQIRWMVSSGGGGGWMTAGASMVGGGAGGGSSFVLSDIGYNLQLSHIQKQICDYYTSRLTEEEWNEIEQSEDPEGEVLKYIKSFFGDWVDYNEEEYKSNQMLYGLNCGVDWWNQARWSNAWVEFRRGLNGNGCVLISLPNEKIYWDPTDNSFKNVADIFYYTGAPQEWVVGGDDTVNKYHIICYGASGGDRFSSRCTRSGMSEDIYLGGFGGCASGVFSFKGGDKLQVIVGQKGQRYQIAYPDGGYGLGGYTGGGGSSCLCWDVRELASRIIVAGGGGGVYAKLTDPDEPGEEEEGWKQLPSKYLDPDDEDSESINKELTDMTFFVNDQSIVHVQVKVFNQVIVPPDAKQDCSIYINEGQEGEMHQTVRAESGEWVHQYDFYLDKLYPPMTPTHEVTIKAQIKNNYFSVLAEKGIKIWVTTKPRLDENIDLYDNHTKFKNILETLEVEDFCECTMESKKELTRVIEEQTGITDFIDLLLERKGDISEELQELIDIRDFIDITKVTLVNIESDSAENIEFSDGVEYKLVHLQYIYNDTIEELNVEEAVDVKLKPPSLVTVEVSPDTPYGTADKSVEVIYENYHTFKAYPNSGYSTEWYIGDVLVGTLDSLTILVTDPITLTVLFIGEEVEIPYIKDGLTGSFDTLLNTGTGYRNDITIWKNLVYVQPEIDTDEDGFVIGVTDFFDGLNTGNQIWKNSKFTQPVIDVNSDGYVVNPTDSFDGAVPGTGDTWINKEDNI